MFRIRLSCTDINTSVGETAAREIQSEFRDRRPWHQDVSCRFEQGTLTLCATNDFDKAGLALLDEFGDCLSAYLKEHGKVSVLSVETL